MTMFDTPSVKSRHAANYINFCHSIVPSKASVQQLIHMANKVPLDEIPGLLPEVRTVAIQRCTASLLRVRSDKQSSAALIKSYERYLGLAKKGESLVEKTLSNSFTNRLKKAST